MDEKKKRKVVDEHIPAILNHIQLVSGQLMDEVVVGNRRALSAAVQHIHQLSGISLLRTLL